MQTYINTDKIVKIRVWDKKLSVFKWLPRKRKTALLGLIKKGWYEEGFYQDGKYRLYFDREPLTDEDLMSFIVDGKNVYDLPKAVISLPDEDIEKRFRAYEEALAWAEELREKSGKLFEII